jgi:F-type H+-transporting ATPase subunit b
MFELNGTFVIFMGLFLVFMFLLNKIMLEPVGRVIERRKARIKQDYQSAQICNEQAGDVLSQYENHLHTIRQDSQKVIQEAAQLAQEDRLARLKAAQAEGFKRVEAIKEELTAERSQLINSLIEPELELVEAISDKLLGEKTPLTIEREKVGRLLGVAN